MLLLGAGRTYTPIYHPDRLAEFKLHPTRSNMLLASVLTRRCYTHEAEGHCYKNLLMSSDHGETWRCVRPTSPPSPVPASACRVHALWHAAAPSFVAPCTSMRPGASLRLHHHLLPHAFCRMPYACWSLGHVWCD